MKIEVEGLGSSDRNWEGAGLGSLRSGRGGGRARDIITSFVLKLRGVCSSKVVEIEGGSWYLTSTYIKEKGTPSDGGDR